MTTDESSLDGLPAAVEGFLANARDALRARKIDRLRLHPLILRKSLEALLERRQRLFHAVNYQKVSHGVTIQFAYQLKASPTHPDGRLYEGSFDILKLTDELIIIASALIGDEHKYGPRRFAEKAYPIARRPFFPSTSLVRLIEKFSKDRGSTAITTDVYGYHRQSRKLRRDLDGQSPASAAREMAEQDRLVHRMEVKLFHSEVETSRLSLDRHAAVTISKGNPIAAVRDLILPGISESLSMEKTYEVTRSPEPVDQELVELDFQDEPFDSYESMRTLCEAVRQGDGLNVTVIHLNPYLHAQILDFFTGAALELLVTNNRIVTLIPRSADCSASMERVATTIYRNFGEAKPRRTKLLDSF